MIELTMAKKYSFVKSTLKFCIAGVFIPGFTAIAILGLQMGFAVLGIECADTWIIVWTLTTIGMVTVPIVFIKKMKTSLSDAYELPPDKLIIFNVIEYTLIQASLAMFFTNARTVCYATDGQNGLEFAFTGWMALPCLISLSYFFDTLKEKWKKQMELSYQAKHVEIETSG